MPRQPAASIETARSGRSGSMPEGGSGAWLSATEAELYAEFTSLVRRLGRRGVSGMYVRIANVAEAVAKAHAEGRPAIRELTRALDAARSAEAAQRKKRWAYYDQVLGQTSEEIMFGCLIGLVALGVILYGISIGWQGAFYVGGFLIVVALLLFSPAIWRLTRPGPF